ncbi:fucolectin-1-like isoform X1 [Lepisosteus oculatus]|uniref:fucolectin-1-like isoform X1 n=1 Tax=Lepisosteus oculatus TaxID=7918 RepID=UPI0035F5006F
MLCAELIRVSILLSLLFFTFLAKSSTDDCNYFNIENVALRGKATLSKPYNHLGLASNGIDGNHDGIFEHGSCVHTGNHDTPWWRVDLLEPHRVEWVIITTRGDCCPEQINGSDIRIGNSLDNNGNQNPRCATITNLQSGISATYKCNGMDGRYINIVKPGKTGVVVFCEFEVYGVPLKKEYCTSNNKKDCNDNK